MTVKKRGLGRGLDALLGGVKFDASPETEKVRSLPIEFMQSGRFQPRKDFDPVRLQELADSIAAQGVVQPIVVRPLEQDRYEIIAGERRWRAAQLAGLHDVPVVVRDIGDQAALAVALIENLQREDLSPLEEAEALKRLQLEFSLTHQQIADSVGKSRAMVTNLLRLNDLSSPVKELLQKRSIEMGHARAILALDLAMQENIAAKVAGKKLSVRETEALIRKIQETTDPNKILQNRRDPDISRLEERMMQSLGTRVEIKHGKNGIGKLVINYDSLDQLEGVLARLG